MENLNVFSYLRRHGRVKIEKYMCFQSYDVPSNHVKISSIFSIFFRFFFFFQKKINLYFFCAKIECWEWQKLVELIGMCKKWSNLDVLTLYCIPRVRLLKKKSKDDFFAFFLLISPLYFDSYVAWWQCISLFNKEKKF